MLVRDWNIEEMTGYKPKTTFYTDFSIADAFGLRAVKDTYERCMEAWKTDCVFLTELVRVLNWKILEHHYEGNTKYEDLYTKLWNKADKYAMKTLKGEELSYFFRTTD